VRYNKKGRRCLLAFAVKASITCRASTSRVSCEITFVRDTPRASLSGSDGEVEHPFAGT